MKQSARRVNIVPLKLIKESSILFKQRQIYSADDAFDLLKIFLSDKDREHFIVLTLDSSNQPVNINICHIGSLNASLIHPREFMKTAILSSAASIMIAHNRPSGICKPSKADIHVTTLIKQAGDLLGIELLDHLIIGHEQFIYMKRKGYL